MNIDLSNKTAFLILGVLLLILAAFLHWDGQILQYLFYLRVPLIGGILLFLLPVICIYGLPSMLGNIFVMSNPWRLAMVMAGSVAVGLGVVLIGAVIGSNADERFNLSAIGWLECLANPESLVPYFLAIFLALPIARSAYWASGPTSQEMDDPQRRLGAVLGAGLSLIFLFAVYWLRAHMAFTPGTDLLVSMTSIFPEKARAGYVDAVTGALANGHAVLACYMLVATLLYVVGLPLYRPRAKKHMQLPVISYVLGLLQIFSLVLGLLTFLLDYYRVPVLLSMLAVSALSYWLWKVDHYYNLQTCQIAPPEPVEIFQAVQQRLSHQGNDKTLVVICASGGGIQAAGWTTQVLNGLQQALGPSFTKAIGLISAVSGGSVGTLHFLDRFDASGAPPNNSQTLDEIFEASTADSLGSTGWGLVYPDLWRLLGLPFLTTEPRDRGAAIDRDWKNHMLNPNATLRGWVGAVQKGEMPIPVFNATIVEDGRHYLLSPMTFGVAPEQGLEFNRLYPTCDVDVSSAALLSATFPYVTPVTRNSPTPQNEPIFHVADGGYFDNFGVVTAIDFLEKLLEQDRQRTIKNVLLVEIRAFPDQDPLTTALDKRVGWKMALFGPIFTIVGARNSTQSQRNADDVNDLIKKFQGQVEILDYKIAFPKVKFFEMPVPKQAKAMYKSLKNTKDNKDNAAFDSFLKKKAETLYKPPLSWTLTKKQRLEIRNAWGEILSDQENDAIKLIAKWKALYLS